MPQKIALLADRRHDKEEMSIGAMKPRTLRVRADPSLAAPRGPSAPLLPQPTSKLSAQDFQVLMDSPSSFGGWGVRKSHSVDTCIFQEALTVSHG